MIIPRPKHAKSVRLIARMPTLTAAAYRIGIGRNRLRRARPEQFGDFHTSSDGKEPGRVAASGDGHALAFTPNTQYNASTFAAAA